MQIQPDNKPYDDINVTPMLDLAYVLLIIFIVMTTATVQGMKVNLPKASATPSLAQQTTKAITVANDGKIFLDTIPVTLPELEQRLVQRFIIGLERIIPAAFDAALGIRTVGEGATRRPVGAAEESRTLLGKLAKKAARKTRRRRSRKSSSSGPRCTPMQGGTSGLSSPGSTHSPSESKLASGQEKSPTQKQTKRRPKKLNKVGRRYQLATTPASRRLISSRRRAVTGRRSRARPAARAQPRRRSSRGRVAAHRRPRRSG